MNQEVQDTLRAKWKQMIKFYGIELNRKAKSKEEGRTILTKSGGEGSTEPKEIPTTINELTPPTAPSPSAALAHGEMSQTIEGQREGHMESEPTEREPTDYDVRGVRGQPEGTLITTLTSESKGAELRVRQGISSLGTEVE